MPDQPLSCSAKMVGTCKRFGAVQHYFQESQEVAAIIAEMFKATFPDDFKTYEAAFKAGRWIQQDPGPFIARVLVYKLDTEIHYDDQDVGPTVVFPVGQYTQGYMEFPQLKARFL